MKSIAGVLNNWYKEYHLDCFIVVGQCELHKTPEFMNEQIHTSRVASITPINDELSLCETKNSLYILIGKERV